MLPQLGEILRLKEVQFFHFVGGAANPPLEQSMMFN